MMGAAIFNMTDSGTGVGPGVKSLLFKVFFFRKCREASEKYDKRLRYARKGNKKAPASYRGFEL